MSLDGGRDMLAGDLKTLMSRWDLVAPHWQDAMKVQFIERILIPLQDETAATLQAIEIGRAHV